MGFLSIQKRAFKIPITHSVIFLADSNTSRNMTSFSEVQWDGGFCIGRVRGAAGRTCDTTERDYFNHLVWTRETTARGIHDLFLANTALPFELQLRETLEENPDAAWDKQNPTLRQQVIREVIGWLKFNKIKDDAGRNVWT